MLHFEDFHVGETVSFGGYDVIQDEIDAYAGEFHPLSARHGETDVTSIWHVCAMMMRMMCEGFLLDATSQGAPGVEEIVQHAPVRAGERLRMRRTVLNARRSNSRPDLGLVHFRFEVLNAAGELKLACRNWILFSTREVPA